tara:strand:- start:76 stop:681 length:606 start_codon:yes stop_codon:yes gene_type:complete
MDYVIRIIEQVAWPIAIIWLGYMFRSEVRVLISRVSEFKYKDVQAKFDRELVGAEIQASSLPSSTTSNAVRGLEQLPYSKFIEIAEVSSRAAILEAWIELESSVFAASKEAGIKVQNKYDAFHLIKQLYEQNRVPKETVNTFKSLRSLRNQAAHLPDFALDSDEATRYLDLALKVVASLAMVGEKGLTSQVSGTPHSGAPS